MVGVKRPARETYKSSTKKLKVLNSVTPLPPQPRTKPSKNVPARAVEPEGASENDQTDSDSSPGENGEDTMEASWTAKSKEPPRKTRTDTDDVSSATLNGQRLLIHINSHGSSLR